MQKLLTKRELEVVLYLLDADDGDPLKHFDDPSEGYDLLASARSKLRRALKRRQ